MTPAEIEGTAGRDAVVSGGRLHAPFGDHVVAEGCFHSVGYLLRLPSHGGHWVSIVPSVFADVSAPAHILGLLCDSLYRSPFSLTQKDIEELLVACAMDCAHAAVSDFQGEWGCFLVAYPG